MSAIRKAQVRQSFRGLSTSLAFWVSVLTVIQLSMATSTSRAQEGDERVSVHGFAHWSAGYTNNENEYGHIASEDGNYHHLGSTLYFGAALAEKVRVATQTSFIVHHEGTETSIDFAFAEYAFSDALKFKIGQIPQAFGLYSEVLRVATLRPFAELPSSIYGPTGGISDSFKGFGFSGRFELGDDSALVYDSYFGDLEVPFNAPWHVLEGEAEGEEAHDDHADEHAHSDCMHDAVGLKLTVETPLDGLKVGAAGYSGACVTDGYKRRYVFGGHLEYLGNEFFLRGEYMHVLHESSEIDALNGFYIEAGYTLFESLQLAAQYQAAFVSLKDDEFSSGPGSSLLDHQEIAASINYFFDPRFVLKFSYHYVMGNRFVLPHTEEVESQFAAGNLDLTENTQALIISTAFSF